MENHSFSWKARIKSFKYAFRGIGILIKYTHNARIHLFATVCVVIAGFIFHLDTYEWIAIIFAVGSVFTAEAFNSAIEYLADKTSKEQDRLIKNTKDVAAAAVLIAAIMAAVIGLIVFVPKIIDLW